MKVVHEALTRAAYCGRHQFNRTHWRTRSRKAPSEVFEVAVPRIVSPEVFEEVQGLLRSRSPKVIATRLAAKPSLLAGIARSDSCGGSVTLRAGKSGRYRYYYTCSTAARQGKTACRGRSVPMPHLDGLVGEALSALLQPDRLSAELEDLLRWCKDTGRQQKDRLGELRARVTEASDRLRRLYASIEAGSWTRPKQCSRNASRS